MTEPTAASKIPDKPTIDGLEDRWSQNWETDGVYRFNRTATRDQVYSIDTPPPTASGSLHVGHVFSYTHTDTIARFQRELAAMGYKFQFVTLAGFHSVNHGMFELARDYKERGMAAYSELQQAEFASEKHGYTATRHQREVGTGYFDEIAQVISGGAASTLALEGSTEAAQF